jgi:hypothetical protein
MKNPSVVKVVDGGLVPSERQPPLGAGGVVDIVVTIVPRHQNEVVDQSSIRRRLLHGAGAAWRLNQQ